MSERVTRAKAIRLKCLDCMCGNAAEVRRCVVRDCPLFRYRLGHEVSEGNDTAEGADDENTPENEGVQTDKDMEEDNADT